MVNQDSLKKIHQMALLRSSRSEVFFKKGVLRNFAKFTGKTCNRVTFLIKLQASGLTFSHRTPPVAASDY